MNFQENTFWRVEIEFNEGWVAIGDFATREEGKDLQENAMNNIASSQDSSGEYWMPSIRVLKVIEMAEESSVMPGHYYDRNRNLHRL